MRVTHVAGGFLILLVIGVLVTGVGVSGAAERHWQNGTWKDMGVKRNPWVGGGASGAGPLGSTTGVAPQVGTYVIETPGFRLELEDTIPIGGFGSFDASVTIGASVTFAVNKNVAYIRNADGTEHKLRITRKIARATP
jgi:hypothetical protein